MCCLALVVTACAYQVLCLPKLLLDAGLNSEVAHAVMAVALAAPTLFSPLFPPSTTGITPPIYELAKRRPSTIPLAQARPPLGGWEAQG